MYVLHKPSNKPVQFWPRFLFALLLVPRSAAKSEEKTVPELDYKQANPFRQLMPRMITPKANFYGQTLVEKLNLQIWQFLLSTMSFCRPW